MTATTAQGVDDVVKRQFEAINRHDVPAFVAGYRADARISDPWYPEPLEGASALKKDFDEFFGAFPDLKFTLQRVFTDGDEYGVEFSMKGTHDGPLVMPSGQVPATKRRIEIPGSVFGRIDGDGRIVDERRQYDVARLLSQLGLMQ